MKHIIILSNLVVSTILILIILSLAYFLWFPSSLLDSFALNKNATILVVVNLCLVFLFAYFLYKKNSKQQKFELALLFSIQIGAMLFGAYSIYSKHPVYAVFTVDRFTLINATNATPEKTQINNSDISFLSKTQFVYAKMPNDQTKRNEILMGFMLRGEPDLDGRPEHYEPYSIHKKSIVKKGISENQILTHQASKDKLDEFFKKHGESKQLYAYLPLQLENKDVIWVLDKSTAKPIGVLDIDPWQFSKTEKTSRKKNLPRRWLI